MTSQPLSSSVSEYCSSFNNAQNKIVPCVLYCINIFSVYFVKLDLNQYEVFFSWHVDICFAFVQSLEAIIQNFSITTLDSARPNMF